MNRTWGQRFRDPHFRRQIADRVANIAIRTGGLFVILAIFSIAVVLFGESAPLFRSPRVEILHSVTPAETGPAGAYRVWLLDEYGETLVHVVSASPLRWIAYRWPGMASFLQGTVRISEEASRSGMSEPDEIVAGAVDPFARRMVVATNDHRVIVLRPEWRWAFRNDRRYLQTIEVHAVQTFDVPVEPGDRIVDIAISGGEETTDNRMVVRTRRGRIWLLATVETGGLLETVREPRITPLPLPAGQVPTALTVTDRYVYVGDRNGRIHVFDIADPESVTYLDAVVLHPDAPAPITALQYLIGRMSIVVGDARGRVCVAFPVPTETGWRLMHIRDLRSHTAPVRGIIPAPMTRAFFTLAGDGEIAWHHSTAGTTRWVTRIREGTPAAGVLAQNMHTGVWTDGRGRIWPFRIDDPHPEISIRALFLPVWYEGYDRPRFIWQSSSGEQTSEPKFSLVPLIFGTLKGTVYALIFAIPLSLFGALYMGQFLHPDVRNGIKPIIELMAGLPSVVLGFIGGLWLAPQVERWFPAVLMVHPVFLFAALTGPLIWKWWPIRPRHRAREDLLRLIVLGGWIVLCSTIPFLFNDVIERGLFGGDFRAWFATHFGWQYEQRNAIVVGMVMGYAVIPVIFSIAEESIYSVPRTWIAGALALGATPWQTLRSIVIPASLSGIVSAVMVGFGRAVGETMIVLMATGNTPVLDWSPFSGFRTLSANLAVELPEAPVGETHYRILFLSALLLFVITIIINTAAELLRERIRRQYYRK